MQFLADVFVPCEQCEGKRFKPQVLEVKYRGRGVDQVLDMTVREALTFFSSSPKVLRRLQVLDEIGLGYLRLGQPATTLSGGEAQRIKIAAHLSSQSGDRVLYILDEPTTGLHFDDIAKLLAAFRKLLQAGHSLLVIEHNLDVIKTADWIIDLGPEGGEEGGQRRRRRHARADRARSRRRTPAATCATCSRSAARNAYGSAQELRRRLQQVSEMIRRAMVARRADRSPRAAPAAAAARAVRRRRPEPAESRPEGAPRARCGCCARRRYPEAIVPLAPLVNDPLDPIQLEAIAAELSFFLVQDVPERRKLGFVVEVRNRGTAAEAFELGPLAVWPRPGAARAGDALLKAVDDENPRVRLEAIYAAATIPKAPLALDAEQLLIKALDHYDPVVRAGAARFAGRAGVKAADRRADQGGQRFERRGALRVDARAGLTARGARGRRAHRAVEVLRQGRRGVVGARRPGADRASLERRGLHRAACRQGSLHLAAPPPKASAGSATPPPSTRSRPAPATIRRPWSARRWPSRCRSWDANYVPRLIEFLADRTGRSLSRSQDYLIELGRTGRDGSAAAPAGARRSRAGRGRRGARRDRRRRVARRAPGSRRTTNRDVVDAAQRAVERIKMPPRSLMIACRASSTRARPSSRRDLIGKVLVHETAAASPRPA